ncbi:hypothetical protein CC78DRAFT_574323 [Lojkania enalia]|uniref:Uncharacterized protein n=1 Tax=Lojkania enalia TaxID=147567 RepID=A0A9P4NBI4_9PLEO|nr:hypothetical protein CC78DRAFT_574323 [Didymosphaeria enalia]
MGFSPASRKSELGKLPAQEPKTPREVVDPDQRDKATIISPEKPLPSRTTSTRIQQPIYPSSTQYTHSDNEKLERPGLKRRRTTAQTRYIDMLLALDTVPRLHNILASFFTWILLAGYIVFPATFNKIQEDSSLDDAADSRLKAQALATVRNTPLLYVAAFACGIGVLGCLWLWWKWRKNYIWVINRIFLPALMNSIAGLISTLVNIYSAQDGQYSVTAKVTIIVTAVCSVVTAALFLLYNSVMLELVKRKHARETRAVESRLTGGSDYVGQEKEMRRKDVGRGHVVGADPGRVV